MKLAKTVISTLTAMLVLTLTTLADESWKPLTVKVVVGSRVEVDEARIIVRRNGEALGEWILAGGGPPRNDGNTVFVKTLPDATIERGDRITVELPILRSKKGSRFGAEHKTAQMVSGYGAFSCMPTKEMEVWHTTDQAFVRIWASPWDESRQTSFAHLVPVLDSLNYKDSIAAYAEIKKLEVTPLELINGLPPEAAREFLRIQQHSFEQAVTSQTRDLEFLWAKQAQGLLDPQEQTRLALLEKKYVAEREGQTDLLKELAANKYLLEAMGRDRNGRTPALEDVQSQLRYLGTMQLR